MCEPVTLTALAAGAAASAGTVAATAGVSAITLSAMTSGIALAAGVLGAGAAASAMGAYNQSKAAKQQARYQSQVAANNAKMAEFAAQDASNRGAEEAARVSAQAGRIRSRQTAALASNGIDISSGSAAAILEDTDFLSAQDATAVRNNAARAAWGFRVEGQNFNSSSAMYRTAARNENPLMSAGASLLNSTSGIAGAYVGAKL